MDELLEAIAEEQNNRFNKTWSKLDKGLKMNRLNNYIEMYDCDDNQRISLKELLIESFINNSLKNDHIEYDKESSQIINIKTLSCENDEFSLNSMNRKPKPKVRSKSKSNVERHFNRSKKSDNKSL